MKRLLIGIVLLAGPACSGSGTPPAQPAAPDVNSLTKLALPVGDSHCPTGGVSVTVNGGGAEYVCNGAVGPQGPGITQASGSRITIKQAVMVGTDGTRSPAIFSYYDNQLATGCTLQTATDGKTRCQPTDAVSADSGYFVDAACSIRMMYSASAACPPKYASARVNFPVDACSKGTSAGTRIFSVGQQVFPTPVPGSANTIHYARITNCNSPGDPCTCLNDGTFSSNPGTVWYSLTELPASTFVEFTPQ
jgi:hypothetical protein